MTEPNSFYKRYSLPIMVIVIFLLPIAFAGARRGLLSNKNDVKQWLPARYEETQVYNAFAKHFAGEEFVLISWEGCTLDDPRLELLAKKLVPHSEQAGAFRPPTATKDDKEAPPPLFSKVQTGPSVIAELMERLNLSYAQALDRLKGSLVGPDLRTTCAVLTLSAYARDHLRPSVNKLVQVATKECSIPRDTIHMGGPPVDNVAIDEAGEQSLVRLASMSGIIGLAVSWWSLRSGRLVAMVMFTGIYTIGLSMAIVWYSGTPMNAILLSMPSLVYVTATSGAIHLANYYRDTVDAEGPVGAASKAIHHAWLPLSLATGTTAVGLVSLCYSELVPIQLFGIYSALGVVVSLLLLFFFLPAALELWPVKPHQHHELGPKPPGRFDLFWERTGRWIVDHHNAVAVSLIALVGLCALGIPRIQTSVQMMRFFNGDARILKDYAWLEKHLGELVPVEVVININQDTGINLLESMRLVDRVQKRINEIPEVGSSLSTVTFAPSVDRGPRTGRLGALIGGSRTADAVLNKRLTNHLEEFLDGDYLRYANDAYMWRISARVGALKNVDYAKFIDVLKHEVEPVIDQEKARIAQKQKLPAENLAGVDVVYTGLVPIVYKAQTSLLDGLIVGFLSDLALIILVMIVAVRSLAAGMLLTLTSVFPAAIIFGLMGWLGIIVDVGTVMTPAVALGVTVDDVVHFMLWFRRGIGDGMNRKDSVMLAYRGCARAMYQSWGVIGIGLSVFAFSPFTPTQRFGYLMLTLLTAALPGNLLLLPALLAGPLGRLFAWRVKRAPAAEAMPEARPQPAFEPNHRRRIDRAASIS